MIFYINKNFDFAFAVNKISRKVHVGTKETHRCAKRRLVVEPRELRALKY